MKRLAVLLCHALTASYGVAAVAMEIERAEIDFRGKTYHYAFVAVIAGPLERVRAVVTDYDHLTRLNDDIVESRVLERYGPGELKRVLRLEQCILLFCFDLAFVERVEASAARITTVIIPDESTFRDGTAEWTLEALDDGRTRITVTAVQTPDFWIPPLLGPFILKRVFLREVRETCASIERVVLERAPR